MVNSADLKPKRSERLSIPYGVSTRISNAYNTGLSVSQSFIFSSLLISKQISSLVILNFKVDSNLPSVSFNFAIKKPDNVNFFGLNKLTFTFTDFFSFNTFGVSIFMFCIDIGEVTRKCTSL